MTTQEFFDKWNNKGIDFDGYYGFQCMDLAHQYAVEVVGIDIHPAPAAKDVWNETIDGYDKIENTPEGVPTRGDIVIWGTGVGAYGHIAVFDHGDQNSFTSFDQNWPLNSLCHYQNHNYNGVLGWFHPQKDVNTVPVVAPVLQGLAVDVGYNPDHLGQTVEVNGVVYESTSTNNVLSWQVVPPHVDPVIEVPVTSTTASVETNVQTSTASTSTDTVITQPEINIIPKREYKNTRYTPISLRLILWLINYLKKYAR